MGLVALWRWLAMHCRTATPSQPGQVQALFIDFPAILSLARSHDVPEEEFHAYLLREVCRIIALVNPTQLVYIGEDGCLPRAKSQTKWKRDEWVKKKAIAKAQAQKKKELEEEWARKKKEREEARRKRKKRKKEEQARKKKEMEEAAANEKEVGMEKEELQEVKQQKKREKKAALKKSKKEEQARKKKEMEEEEETEKEEVAAEKVDMEEVKAVEEEEETEKEEVAAEKVDMEEVKAAAEEEEDVEGEQFEEEEEEEEVPVKQKDLANVKPKAPVVFREDIITDMIAAVKTDPSMAKDFPELKRIDVIFDTKWQWKEAEHKVIDFLRSNDQALTWTWAMWSGDSDLVPLTLALRCDNMFIMNSNQRDRKSSDYWLGDLRRDISRLGDGTDQSVDDFICLTAMVENDFLPGIGSIDSIVAAYQDMYGRTSKHLIRDGCINTDVLKELFRSLLRVHGKKEDCVCNSERERQMCECYLSGLTWYTNLYFGIGLDWSYCYLFACPPAIGSLIGCLDDGYEAPTSINRKPEELDLHPVYRDVKRRATLEQIKMVFNEVFGTSLDDILPTEKYMRNNEIMRRVFSDPTAMDRLRCHLNLGIRNAQKHEQSTRCFCPKAAPQIRKNPWTKIKLQQKESVLRSSEAQRLLVFEEGENVVLRQKGKARIGVVAGHVPDGRYQVRMHNTDEQVETFDGVNLWSITDLTSKNGPHKNWSIDSSDAACFREVFIDAAIIDVNRYYEECAKEIEKTQKAFEELQRCLAPSRRETELTKVLEQPQSDIIAFLISENPSKHFHPVVRQDMGTVTSLLSVLLSLTGTLEAVTCLRWLEEALLNVDLQVCDVRDATIMVLKRIERCASSWLCQFRNSGPEFRHTNMILYTVKSLLTDVEKHS